MSNLFRNVPFLTSIEMSPFLFRSSFWFFRLFPLKICAPGSSRNDVPLLARPMGSLIFRPVGLARSAALRSPQGEAEGQANDGRGAVAPNLEALFCAFGRGGSCHGWLGGGVHFRFLTEIGTRGDALRADTSRACGCAGAAISHRRNARPPDSMLILPYHPSHTHTLLRAGTMCPLCGSSWKK